MIQINVNQLKRAYAFVKDNIITIIIIVAVILGLLSTLLIVRDKEAPQNSDNKDVSYQTIHNQRFGISNVHTLNPITSKDRDTYYIDKLIFNGLFKQNNDLSLSLDLAKDYKVNTNSGTVIINLRKDIKFHNGDVFNASDVVHTFDYINSNGKGGLYYNMANRIDSIVATGNYQVKVFFKSAKDASLDNLTFPILSNSSADSDFKPNGTGQYRIAKVDAQKYIRLKPNENYFGDKASNSLYFQIFKKSTVIENLLTSYEVTCLFDKSISLDKDNENSQVTTQYVDSNNLEYIGFNYKDIHLRQKEMRQAIAYSMDLNELVDEAYGKYGKLNDSIYFPGYLGVENKGEVYKCDYNKAIKLIKKMNLYDQNKDGYIEDIEGKTINYTILVNKNDASRMLVANYLSDCLTELQIKNEVKALSWNSYVTAYKKKQFDIVIGGYSINPNDKLEFMFDRGNSINFDNKKILKLVKQLNACTSIEQTKTNYSKLKETLNEELPYYCICYKQYKLLGCPNMSFEELPNFDNVYKGVSTWEYKKIVSNK